MKIISFFFSVFIISSLAGQELVPNHDAEDINAVAKWGKSIRVNTSFAKSGKCSFELTKIGQQAVCPKFIKIDPQKSYTLSAFLRSADKDKLASAYFGLRFFDKDKKEITLRNVGVYQDTANELIKAASKGSKTITVRQNNKWSKKYYANGVVAFHSKDDFSDLPNRDISAPIVDFLTTPKECVVKLKHPLAKSYPRGTKVRLHSPYGAGLYWVATGFQDSKWTKYETVITAFDKGISAKHFPYGTLFVKPFIKFGNWNKIPRKGAKLLVDKISFYQN